MGAIQSHVSEARNALDGKCDGSTFGPALFHEGNETIEATGLSDARAQAREWGVQIALGFLEMGMGKNDVVVSMLPKVHAHMAGRGLDLRKLHIVPNGIALDDWQASPQPLREDSMLDLTAYDTFAVCRIDQVHKQVRAGG